jgi:hypothetical protein
LILAGAGYFAYSKGLINLDFLKRESVVEPVAVESKELGVIKPEETITVEYINEYVKSLNLITDYKIKEIDNKEDVDSAPVSIQYVKDTAFIKNEKIYKIVHDLSWSAYHTVMEFYAKDGELIYFYQKTSSWSEESFDQVKYYFDKGVLIQKDVSSNTSEYKNIILSANEALSGYKEEVNFITIKDTIKKEIKKQEVQTPPKTNTTTTYMCEGRVKIVREQDSPSLPPRVSYLRVSDGAGIASYGDFGAYIRPEYFSIDRAQIEEGYGFNETNFCKYLKS